MFEDQEEEEDLKNNLKIPSDIEGGDDDDEFGDEEKDNADENEEFD